MEENKVCFPACDSFKCDQRALIYAGRRIYCRWADDDCVGHTCNYAVCVRGRLLPNGVCGLTIKRKTEDIPSPVVVERNIDVKLRGKLNRRFKEDDLV